MSPALYVVSRSLPSLLAAALAGCGNQGSAPPPEPPPPRPVAVVLDAAGPHPSEGSGASAQLYAAGVPLATLPLSIGIETLGGVATAMLPRGTPLPTTHTEIFSTASDDQPSVEVAVIQGERAFAKDDRAIGKFQLLGIPPAPRGVPQVQVTFAVDATGRLSVTALDLATKQARDVRVEGTFGAMIDAAAIARALADAEATRGADEVRRARSDSRLRLQSLAQSTRKLLEDTILHVPAGLQTRVRAALLRANTAENGGSASVASLDAAFAELEAVEQEMAQVLYDSAPPAR